MKENAVGQFEDLRDAAEETYESAAKRLARASRAMRGDYSYVLRNALQFAAGIGVGIGVGLILAPASGEETRSAIADRVQGIGDKVRKQFSTEHGSATGTGN